MSCVTTGGMAVETLVYGWLNPHPNLQGIWNVFETPNGLDVVVSIQSTDGTRHLTLVDQQAQETLADAGRVRVLSWLENLQGQPIVQ